MNTEKPRDDDAALRALLAEPHIDEDGFSARVASALPARKPRARVSRRSLAIAGGTIAAALCGAAGAGALETTLPFGALGAMVPFAVVVAAMVWGLVEGARSES
jgi:hypothetical protein